MAALSSLLVASAQLSIALNRPAAIATVPTAVLPAGLVVTWWLRSWAAAVAFAVAMTVVQSQVAPAEGFAGPDDAACAR